MLSVFFFSSRRRHTRCALVTGVQTCALPIYEEHEYQMRSHWDRFVAEVGRRIAGGETDLADREDLACVVDELICFVGRDAVVALSLDYAHGDRLQEQLGRASCRERVGQYVSFSVVAGSLKKKKQTTIL